MIVAQNLALLAAQKLPQIPQNGGHVPAARVQHVLRGRGKNRQRCQVQHQRRVLALVELLQELPPVVHHDRSVLFLVYFLDDHAAPLHGLFDGRGELFRARGGQAFYKGLQFGVFALLGATVFVKSIIVTFSNLEIHIK